MSFRPACFAALLLTACWGPPPDRTAAPSAAPELELVTYSVAPAASPKVQGILRRLLRPSDDDAVGTYAEAPGGRIAVLAPATVQSGVAAMLAEVGTAESADPAPANLRFTYWMVSGTPADAQPGPVSAELRPLADTLAAIAGWDGPQFFRLVGHTTLTSIDGDRAEAASRRLQVAQIASIDPATGHILADIDLELRLDSPGSSPEMETRVQLQPGQTLILSTLDGGDAGSGHFYLVVRADILPAA